MERYAFLIGAPRCGTSALYSWISAHPDVVASRPKETFYFVDADHPLRRKDGGFQIHGPGGFARFFPASELTRGLRFEATTHYLYQQGTPALLRQLFPQAQAIAVLRDPVRRLISSFNYSQHNLADIDDRLDVTRFVELLLAQQYETIRLHVRSERTYRVLIRQLSHSDYLPHLVRWQSQFGERLLVVQFESMVTNPAAATRALATWLDIDATFYDAFDFTRKNETRAVRWPRLHRAARSLRLRLGARAVFRMGRGIYGRLQGSAPIASPRPEAVAALYQHFAPLNAQLAGAFPLDLALWRQPLA